MCFCIWHRLYLCSLWQRQAGWEPASSQHVLPSHPAQFERPSWSWERRRRVPCWPVRCSHYRAQRWTGPLCRIVPASWVKPEERKERRADGCTAGAQAEFLGVSEYDVKICCLVFQAGHTVIIYFQQINGNGSLSNPDGKNKGVGPFSAFYLDIAHTSFLLTNLSGISLLAASVSAGPINSRQAGTTLAEPSARERIRIWDGPLDMKRTKSSKQGYKQNK